MIAAPARLVRARPVGARIARADDRLVLIALVAIVLLVTGLPDLIARVSAPPDRVFMGIVLNVPDTAQYLSWARESSRAVLIENRLTPERGEPVFFNLFWLGVGRLAAGLGLGLTETLHARASLGHPEPDDPGPTPLGEPSRPVESEREPANIAGGVLGGCRDIGKARFGRLAKEGKGHVEVVRPNAAKTRQGLGKDRERALGDVRRKRDRDEQPHARTLLRSR